MSQTVTKTPQNAGRILIVEDDADMANLLAVSLEHEAFRVDVAASLDAMKERLRQFTYDAVLLDLYLGDERGVEAIPYIVREAPFALVIVMTAFGSIEVAVEAMGMGATSFLTKSDDPGKITRELKDKLGRRGASAKPGAGDDALMARIGLIGRSPVILKVMDDLEKIKDVDATVLLYGESGTGKELIARAIHRLSKRSGAKFEAVNCAAIPEALLESELFGHKKGAFTDARNDRKGILEVCAGGVLLLDEIGEMPLSLQAKLLRVLQEKEFTPIGSTQALKVTTRIIAATNRDLEEEVARGRFREDLFFRLNVLPLYVPPLRQRQGDVPLLAHHFIDRFNARYGKALRPPSRELLARLASYPWPGNVRELSNSIERAVVLSKSDQLDIEDVLRRKMSPQRGAPGLNEAPDYAQTLSYAEAKEGFERSFLMRILTVAKGSIAEAARLSGRYRSDIYRLMERYGINPEEFKG